MMRALGADVVLVDQAPGSRPGEVSGADLELVEKRVQEITREMGAFRADQFERQGNVNAHLLGTGPEILRQTQGRFDAFLDFVGSGGTFAGCARAFKQCNPDIRCFVVEPAGAAVLAGKAANTPNHPIQGGGYARSLSLVDPADVDGYVTVTGDEARAGARRLAREEGLFAGFSTGANYMAARHLLQHHMAGATVVFIAADSGLKYLSTDLWP
jgi:cysteine synthase A